MLGVGHCRNVISQYEDTSWGHPQFSLPLLDHLCPLGSVDPICILVFSRHMAKSITSEKNKRWPWRRLPC